MEREIANVIEFGIVFAALAAVLWVVIFTIFVGNEIKMGSFEKIDNSQEAVYRGELQELASQEGTELPVAALLNLVEANRDYIEEIRCHIEGSGTDCSMGEYDALGKELEPPDIVLLNGITDASGKVIIKPSIDSNCIKKHLAEGGGKCTIKVGYDKSRAMYRIHIVQSS